MREYENIQETCAFNKVYDCHMGNGTIIVEGSLAGGSRKPLMRHKVYVDIYKDDSH